MGVGNLMGVWKSDEAVSMGGSCMGESFMGESCMGAHSAEVVVIHMSAPSVAFANHEISVSVMLV